MNLTDGWKWKYTPIEVGTFELTFVALPLPLEPDRFSGTAKGWRVPRLYPVRRNEARIIIFNERIIPLTFYHTLLACKSLRVRGIFFLPERFERRGWSHLSAWRLTMQVDLNNFFTGSRWRLIPRVTGKTVSKSGKLFKLLRRCSPSKVTIISRGSSWFQRGKCWSPSTFESGATKKFAKVIFDLFIYVPTDVCIICLPTRTMGSR